MLRLRLFVATALVGLGFTWFVPASPAAGLNVTGTITVGAGPTGVAFLPDGTRAYVTNSSANTVSVIDTQTQTLVATIPVSGNPTGIAASATRVVVNTTNSAGHPITIIDPVTNTVTSTISLSAILGDEGIAIKADGSVAWVVVGTKIARVDLTTSNVVYSTDAAMNYSHLAIDPSSAYGFVTSYNSHTISRFSASNLAFVSSVPASSSAVIGLDFSPNGSTLYVADCGGASVHVYDVASLTLTTSISVSGCPYGIDVDPTGSNVFVSRLSEGKVSVIDASTNTVTEEISVGSQPKWLAVSPSGDELYVANHSSNSISVIDLTSLLPTTTSTSTTTTNVSSGNQVSTTTSPATPLPTTGRRDDSNVAVVVLTAGIGLLVATRRRVTGATR